jgi:hypothetical protein
LATQKLKWFEGSFASEIEPLVAKGIVVPSPPKDVVAGGVDGVIPALQKQMKGVSGVKVVVEM